MSQPTMPLKVAPPRVAMLRGLFCARLTVTFLLALLAASDVLAQASRYAFSPDGLEVTDTTTQLVWRRCAEGQLYGAGTCSGSAGGYTHEAALVRAKTEAASSGKAWRVPNAKELFSLVDRSRRAPAIDVIAFPATQPHDYFWSSTPFAGQAHYAWSVFFDWGYIGGRLRNDALALRLVRTSQ